MYVKVIGSSLNNTCNLHMENEQKLGKDVTTQTTKKRKKNKNNIYIYKE